MTGTPGTGKTAIAKALAKAVNAVVIDANALVKRRGLWFNKAKHEADLGRLKKEILREIKKAEREQRGFVCEGHLLCEFPLPCDACVVLRCDPRELARRLRARGYARRKIAENALCEILDYCVIRAERAYGAKRVIQVDATKRVSPAQALRAAKTRQNAEVDWSAVLLNKRFKNGLGLS